MAAFSGGGGGDGGATVHRCGGGCTGGGCAAQVLSLPPTSVPREVTLWSLSRHDL